LKSLSAAQTMALRVQKLVPDMLQANLSREQQPFFC